MTDGVIRVGVEAVELRGPGLMDWASSRAVLAGDDAYCAAPIVLEAPEQLSPAERRRAIPSVRLALAVGAGAVGRTSHDPKILPAVFASSGADSETNSAILMALMTPSRELSPTKFHNSVHNAPSGYWGVAMQSREAVTSLSCHDASFAAGLLEASVQAVFGGRPVLLVAYDFPYPEPLHSVRPIVASFGVAFVLNPRRTDCTFAELEVGFGMSRGVAANGCADGGLESLRRGNPAARSLPLLAMLAARGTGSVRLDLSRGALDVGVTPC
jgi:hypothetical protein